MVTTMEHPVRLASRCIGAIDDSPGTLDLPSAWIFSIEAEFRRATQHASGPWRIVGFDEHKDVSITSAIGTLDAPVRVLEAEILQQDETVFGTYAEEYGLRAKIIAEERLQPLILAEDSLD